MQSLFMAQPTVDFTAVLYGLVAHAQSLSSALVCLDLHEHVVCGGETGADLAMSTIVKFLDPADTTVAWSKEKGEPTTAGVLAYLKKVLRNDFIDITKTKRYRKAVYLRIHGKDDEASEPEATFDAMESRCRNPEAAAIIKDQHIKLLQNFRDDPDLRDLLDLQLQSDGTYNAFTNQELAYLTNTTVSEIENRKKRIKLRLLKLAATDPRKEGRHA
jgi:DNA-directed RNA polymerase specialized sigma24 family protein